MASANRPQKSGATVTFGDGTDDIKINGDAIGFFGVDAVARPDVTGSAGANAALASLLTALESLGLITDSSS